MAILFRGTGGELVFCTVGWDASCYISEGKISIEYCKCDDSLNNDHFHSRCYCWLNEHSHCKSTLFTLVGDYRLESSSKFTEHIKEVYLLGITMYVECYIFFFFFFWLVVQENRLETILWCSNVQHNWYEVLSFSLWVSFLAAVEVCAHWVTFKSSIYWFKRSK